MILYKVLLRDLNDLNPGGGCKLSRGNTGHPICIYVSVARFDGVVPLPLHCADIFCNRNKHRMESFCVVFRAGRPRNMLTCTHRSTASISHEKETLKYAYCYTMDDTT